MHKMLAFIGKIVTRVMDWDKIVVFTLIISFVGGIPGVINFIVWSRDKPDFKFYLETWQNGTLQIDSNGVVHSWIRINGGIYNGGNEPLFPTKYTLQIKYEDSVYSAEPGTISIKTFDSSFKVNKAGMTIKTDKPNNLFYVDRINPHDAVFGSLIMVFPSVTNIDFNEIKEITMLCQDIEDKKHICLIKIYRAPINPTQYFEKTGMHFESIPQPPQH